MAFQSNQGGNLSDINITPLVDVMLVLLVVFMVTTPIIAEDMTPRNVDVDLPNTNAAPVAKSDLKSIVILYPDFKVMLDLGEGPSLLADCPPTPTQDACLKEIEPQLKKNPRMNPEQALFFMADRALPYGFVVDVMARVKNAGFYKVGMVTNPPAQP